MKNQKQKRNIARNVFAAMLAVVLCTASVPAVTVWADEAALDSASQETVTGYLVTETDGVLHCTKDNNIQTNQYFMIAQTEDGYTVASRMDTETPCAIYYFDETGVGSPYTGTAVVSVSYSDITNPYYVKKGKIATAQAAYYTVYNNHLYRVTAAGVAKTYVKSTEKAGTYRKVVNGVCYNVSYRTGAVSKFTGIYNKQYYKSGKLGTGWYTSGSKKYYYQSGNMVTGWKKISDKTYYFQKSGANKGVLQKNTIAGTKTDGYYYVDKNGVRVTSSEIKQAVKFVNAHTKASQSNAEKLKACYNYLWKNYAYKRAYGIPGKKDMAACANEMFKEKKGNCYRYAASFACIARVLGYDSRVAVGTIASAGGGMTPHGWTEIKMSGKWYLFDANMQRNIPSISTYKRTNSNFPYAHTCSARYTLTITGGKVTWK